MIELAGCIIRNSEAELLLLHRYKGREQWELPGGKVEQGEQSKIAAIREIQEELGVTATIVSALGDASFMQDDKEWLYKWYEAQLADDVETPTVCEPQTFDDLRYWKISDLKQRTDISANLRNLLEDGVLEASEA